MSIFKTILSGVTGLPSALASVVSSHKATTAKEVEALANVRKKFPGPDKCVTGSERLSVYTGKGTWNDTGIPCGDSCTYVTNALLDMQKTLDDWHIPRNEPEYINAYNILIGEYKEYYMSHCVNATSTSTGTGDAVLDSAVVKDPSHSGTTAAGAGAGVATTNSSQVAAGSSVTPATSILGKQWIKGVPNWALIAAGGLLVVIAIAIAVKKPKNVSTPA